MMDRRTFLKAAALGTVILHNPGRLMSSPKALYDYFSVHPFIDQNPDAVFIMHTNVDAKTNGEAIKQAAMDFGRSVFVNTNDAATGIPLSKLIAMKPNLTSRGTWMSGYTVEGTMGVITDAYFVEGIIESIKELGINADQFYVREVNGTENLTDGGYNDMGRRTGADVRVIGTRVTSLPESSVVWKDVPDGIWFNKIPYLWPINSPDSWLINISKFKTHGMGVTLCAKNLQGSIASKYQQHCTFYSSNMSIPGDHVQSDAKTVIMDNYNRHVADGVPRWDRPGSTGGIWMETWGTRCLDNNSVTKPELHVIEGVYGRDGNFVEGPHDGKAKDFMTNVIIFGKNPFHVDNIGHYLGGHEPGNFGLFHMAIERGQASILNPRDIPVYEWGTDGRATLKPITEFQRTDLKTYYLQRDYDGQTEDKWHLCNEEYDYPATSVKPRRSLEKPESFVLNQNYPNPFNPTTSIRFTLTGSGRTRIDIYNVHGEVIDRLVDGYLRKGNHLAVWNSKNFPSGTYYYRIRFGGFSETRKMVLVK
ncbi:DUF362 domain-containing protein [candidate division KSB1 bacterium]|nr:DUF362 domain-containing protein [candidate division KSB1 bacterium]